MTDEVSVPERIAREFHATYERKAPAFGYKTRRDSAVPWQEVPDRNRRLMIAVVKELLEDDVIQPGSGLPDWVLGKDAPRT